MFKFEFVFATFAEAQQAMALLAGAAPTVDPVAKAETITEVKAEIKARTEKAKAAPAAAPKPAEVVKPVATPTASETATATSESPAVPAEPAAASPSETISMEMVRAKLAEISQAGKSAQVRELIAGLGVTKLTDVPADKYTELLQKAAAL